MNDPGRGEELPPMGGSALEAGGLEVRRFVESDAPQWDTFVRDSVNGTFLFERAYMDYHGARFLDCSLLVFSGRHLVALLPANLLGTCLVSHGGLTYGGAIVGSRMTAPMCLRIFSSISRFLDRAGIKEVLYKAIPHIYHRQPAEDDRYALFRHGATLEQVELSTSIDLGNWRGLSKSKRHGSRRAEEKGLSVEESTDFEGYFEIAKRRLRERHGAEPTHSADEMNLLAKRFPEQVRLLLARSKSSELVGGVIVYDTGPCVHIQYMAASREGLEQGALDLIVTKLISSYSARRWIDFGTSTEDQGRFLNEGLVRQKEMFGGRSIAYCTYRWPIDRLRTES